jgi:hypothetical protein
MPGYRIVNVRERTDASFSGRYRGHDIQVDREPDDSADGMAFYIIVTAPSGMNAYDGWWGAWRNTLDEAIEEALLGSNLIAKEQRRHSA